MLRLALIDGGREYVRIAPRLRDARFTAVVDRDGDVARTLGVESVADCFGGLLQNHWDQFDAVVLGPANVEARPAARAGKHVLIECPPAFTRGEAETIYDTCGNADVRLMVARPWRFDPSVRAVRRSLDAGQLGDPGLVRIHRWLAGVDPLLELRLVREIDLACWLFDRRPDVVFAVEHRGNPRDEPDHVQAHLGFGGGMALIDWAAELPRGDGYFSLSLIGSAGAAYADDHHNMQLVFGGGHPSARPVGCGDAAALAQLQEFVDVIVAGGDTVIYRADTIRVMEVVEAVVKSLESGDPVHLTEGVA